MHDSPPWNELQTTWWPGPKEPRTLPYTQQTGNEYVSTIHMNFKYALLGKRTGFYQGAVVKERIGEISEP